MHKKLCWLRPAILIFIFVNVVACGQKGPLYLPEASAEQDVELTPEQNNSVEAPSVEQ